MFLFMPAHVIFNKKDVKKQLIGLNSPYNTAAFIMYCYCYS